MRRVTDWSLMETQISPFQRTRAVKRFMSWSRPGHASGTHTAKNAEQLCSYQISEVICETGSNEMLQNDIGNILTLRCMWSTCGLCEPITQIIISCSLIKDTHTAHKETFLMMWAISESLRKKSPLTWHILCQVIRNTKAGQKFENIHKDNAECKQESHAESCSETF